MEQNDLKPSICRVISPYQSPYTDPWTLRTSEELKVSEKESEWPGWLWCTKRDGESRWVPESYLERRGDTWIARRDYEATELSVNAGETLVMGAQESGWVWCTKPAGQSGWVPLDNIEIIGR